MWSKVTQSEQTKKTCHFAKWDCQTWNEKEKNGLICIW